MTDQRQDPGASGLQLVCEFGSTGLAEGCDEV